VSSLRRLRDDPNSAGHALREGLCFSEVEVVRAEYLKPGQPEVGTESSRLQLRCFAANAVHVRVAGLIK
jgi:hypothetical protein